MYHKYYFHIILTLLVLLGGISCKNIDTKATPTDVIKPTATFNQPTDAGKLKQGLSQLVYIYEQEGEQAAITFAHQEGFNIQGKLIGVHIYTIGSSGKAFQENISEMDIKQFNASSLSNLIFAEVDLHQLQTLAEKDFVLYITPPPNVVHP